MDQERQGYESQLDQSQRQIEAQQRQIEALQQQKYHEPQQEDPTKKLQKYADLRQKGLLTEEEFQKLKADLLSQM
jgi:multidrug resistance efflux pump